MLFFGCPIFTSSTIYENIYSRNNNDNNKYTNNKDNKMFKSVFNHI